MIRPLLLVAAACVATVSFAQQKITHPVPDQNFADPTVIQVNGKYYAYATNSHVNGKELHIQVASSTDRWPFDRYNRRANDRSKAIDARQKTIEWLKTKKYFSAKTLSQYESRLQQYQGM